MNNLYRDAVLTMISYLSIKDIGSLMRCNIKYYFDVNNDITWTILLLRDYKKTSFSARKTQYLWWKIRDEDYDRSVNFLTTDTAPSPINVNAINSMGNDLLSCIGTLDLSDYMEARGFNFNYRNNGKLSLIRSQWENVKLMKDMEMRGLILKASDCEGFTTDIIEKGIAAMSQLQDEIDRSKGELKRVEELISLREKSDKSSPVNIIFDPQINIRIAKKLGKTIRNDMELLVEKMDEQVERIKYYKEIAKRV